MIWHKDNWDKLVGLGNGLSPFWIFYGERGVGKATFAKRFAAHLLSSGVDEDKVLKQITEGAHQNFRYIYPEGSEIKVEALSVVRDFLEHKLSGRKMLIIDNADQLNRYAANGLLKLLEQNYADTYVIFIAHNLFKIVETIRSRSFKLSFEKINQSDFPKALMDLYPFVQGSIGLGRWLQSMGGMEFIDKLKNLMFFGSVTRAHEEFVKAQKKEELDFLHLLIRNILYIEAQKDPELSLKYERLNRFILEAEGAHLGLEDHLTTIFVLLQVPTQKIFAMN